MRKPGFDKKEIKDAIRGFYEALYKGFGPQFWWPGRTRFEIITGAILTQNTSWANVEKAIRNLKKSGLLNPASMHRVDVAVLSERIRPAGYFNIKAKRLKNFLVHLFDNHEGSLDRLLNKGNGGLREELLAINGIGPETADSILLYAFRRPEFVVDAYTRRIFSRHGFIEDDTGYKELKALFMENLPSEAALFNEYHALIVKAGKDYCKRSAPLCGGCPLKGYL